MSSRCALVAIAKDEAKYIREWVLYHVAIGIDRVVVYDNDSADETGSILEEMSARYPLTVIPWPSVLRFSPQRSAYNNSLAVVGDCEWVLFLDIDEFVVPWGFDNFPSFIRTIPPAVTAVGLNWRIFGSSGLTDFNYRSVLRTFVRCSREEWSNNRHIKSLARVAAIKEAKIHEVDVHYGDKVNSAFEPLIMAEEGRTPTPVHAGIQINHYQTKTYAEFKARMERGNANFFPGHPNRSRDGSLERFNLLDRNEEEDLRIARFLPLLD